MFLVIATFLTRDYSEERDAALIRAAGRRADSGEATATVRVRVWRTVDLASAIALRKRLAKLPGVKATAREE